MDHGGGGRVATTRKSVNNLYKFYARYRKELLNRRENSKIFLFYISGMWQPLLPFAFDAVGWSGSLAGQKSSMHNTQLRITISTTSPYTHTHKWTSRVSDMRHSSLHIVDELIRSTTTLALPDKKEFRFYRPPREKKEEKPVPLPRKFFLSLKAEEIF